MAQSKEINISRARQITISSSISSYNYGRVLKMYDGDLPIEEKKFFEMTNSVLNVNLLLESSVLARLGIMSAPEDAKLVASLVIKSNGDTSILTISDRQFLSTLDNIGKPQVVGVSTVEKGVIFCRDANETLNAINVITHHISAFIQNIDSKLLKASLSAYLQSNACMTLYTERYLIFDGSSELIIRKSELSTKIANSIESEYNANLEFLTNELSVFNSRSLTIRPCDLNCVSHITVTGCTGTFASTMCSLNLEGEYNFLALPSKKMETVDNIRSWSISDLTPKAIKHIVVNNSYSSTTEGLLEALLLSRLDFSISSELFINKAEISRWRNESTFQVDYTVYSENISILTLLDNDIQIETDCENRLTCSGEIELYNDDLFSSVCFNNILINNSNLNLLLADTSNIIDMQAFECEFNLTLQAIRTLDMQTEIECKTQSQALLEFDPSSWRLPEYGNKDDLYIYQIYDTQQEDDTLYIDKA